MAYNFSNSIVSTEIKTPFFGDFIVARRPGDNLNVITVDLRKQMHMVTSRTTHMILKIK
jgi:hypothetical protein